MLPVDSAPAVPTGEPETNTDMVVASRPAEEHTVAPTPATTQTPSPSAPFTAGLDYPSSARPDLDINYQYMIYALHNAPYFSSNAVIERLAPTAVVFAKLKTTITTMGATFLTPNNKMPTLTAAHRAPAPHPPPPSAPPANKWKKNATSQAAATTIPPPTKRSFANPRKALKTWNSRRSNAIKRSNRPLLLPRTVLRSYSK